MVYEPLSDARNKIKDFANRRTVCKTRQNAASSRSHLVIIVTYLSSVMNKENCELSYKTQIYLIDLAGKETHADVYVSTPKTNAIKKHKSSCLMTDLKYIENFIIKNDPSALPLKQSAFTKTVKALCRENVNVCCIFHFRAVDIERTVKALSLLSFKSVENNVLNTPECLKPTNFDVRIPWPEASSSDVSI